jgi:ferrous iron transport protein A
MASKRKHPVAESGDAQVLTLAQLRVGERGILDRLDLPEDLARRLMELGFLPGHEVVPARMAPGGGPRVFRVDGSEVALRHDTATKLLVHRASSRAAESETSRRAKKV